MAALHPVIHQQRDHPAFGQVPRLWFELSRGTGIPTTAKKEQDGGLGLAVDFFAKDPRLQFHLAHRSVYLGSGIGDLGWIRWCGVQIDDEKEERE